MNHRIPIMLLITILALTLTISTAFADDECLMGVICADYGGLSEEQIAAYPEANVTVLTPNEELMYDRSYYQITGAFDIYDAPNGNIISSMPGGFNFVTVLATQDGWIQINNGQWIRTDNTENTTYIVSRLTGVLLPAEGLQYPMAWTLINQYPSDYPGGTPNEADNDMMWTYTRVNLYAEYNVDGEIWYQIGVNKWISQYTIGKIIPLERPAEIDTERWISVDLYEQIVIAYEGNTPVFAALMASGLPRWETQEGLFHIYYRRTRIEMSAGTPGDDFYYLEEVPWTMFFDEGRALHGAYWHDAFGYRRRHGCVNLSITDANWLYEWVAEDFESFNSPDVEVGGPAVWVYHSGQYAGE
jgi:lipoprotein-anchoring transpeptidase ErfK/SrfK